MRRFHRLQLGGRKWHHWLDVQTPVCYLDFGSHSTRLAVASQVRWHEASCLVWQPDFHQVVSFGAAATAMTGRVPATMELSWPMRHGRLEQPQAAQLFLKSIRDQVCQPTIWEIITRPQIFCAVPSTSSPVDQVAIEQAVREAGWSRVQLVSKAEILRAAWLPRQVAGIVDLGAATTEVCFYTAMGTVASKTVQLGGEAITTAIQDRIRAVYHCQVSESVAEQIKVQLGEVQRYHSRLGTNAPAVAGSRLKGSNSRPASQVKGNVSPQANYSAEMFIPRSDAKLVVRGKDLLKQIPVTIQVAASDIWPAIDEYVRELCLEIRQVLATAPAEVVTGLVENGMVLTGGGSLLKGVADRISQELLCPVALSEQPFVDQIRGLLKYHHPST